MSADLCALECNERIKSLLIETIAHTHTHTTHRWTAEAMLFVAKPVLAGAAIELYLLLGQSVGQSYSTKKHNNNNNNNTTITFNIQRKRGAKTTSQWLKSSSWFTLEGWKSQLWFRAWKCKTETGRYKNNNNNSQTIVKVQLCCACCCATTYIHTHTHTLTHMQQSNYKLAPM